MSGSLKAGLGDRVMADQGVINQVLEAARMVVIEGVGQGRPADGFIIIVGSATEILADERDDLVMRDIKHCKYGAFRTYLDRRDGDLTIGDYLGERKRSILNLFSEDGAIVVDSQSGRVCCGGFIVRDLTFGIGIGGARTLAASAIATQAGGCYVVLASRRICGTVANPAPPYATLTVFDHNREPRDIPVGVSQTVRESSLEQWLRPLKFGADLRLYNEDFIEGTRQWVLDEIEAWRTDVAGSTCRVLLAGPGFGKTAIAVRLHQMTTRVLAIHVCCHDDSFKRDPRRIVTSIAFQIAEALPQFRDALRKVREAEVASATDAHALRPTARELAECLLFQPLSEIAPAQPLGENGRHMIIIDALDEAEHDSKNDLLDLISFDFRKLPPWVAVLVTARPEVDIVRMLAPLRPTVLDADRYKEKCESDVRVYLRRILASRFKDEGSLVEAIETIATKSEGLFLYLHYIRRVVEYGADFDMLPMCLSVVYENELKRVLGPAGLGGEYSQTRRVVEAIIAAQVPVHVHRELPALSGVPHDDVYKLVSRLSQLFPVRDDNRVYIFHKSFADWLTCDESFRESKFIVDRCAAHRRLASACGVPLIRLLSEGKSRSDAHAVNALKRFVKAHGRVNESRWSLRAKARGSCRVDDSHQSLALNEYALRWSVTHFVESGDPEDVSVALLHSLRFLIKRAPQIDVLIADAALLLPKTSLLHRALVLAENQVRLCGAQWLAEELWQRLLRPAQGCDDMNLRRLARDAHLNARDNLMFSSQRAYLTPADSPLHCAFEGHSDNVYCIKAFVDAKGYTWVTSCSKDNTVNIWDPIKGGEAVVVLLGHSSYVSCVTSFVDAMDHTWVVTCSFDKTVRIWDPFKSGEAVHVLKGHSSEVNGVVAFADTKGHPLLASWSKDATIRIWDPIEGGEAVNVLKGHSLCVNGVTDFVTANACVWLASCSEDSTVRIWDPINGGKAVHVLTGHSDSVRGVTTFKDAKGQSWVASCSNDSTVCIWDPIKGGDAFRVLTGHTNIVKDVTAFVFAKGQMWIASCSKDNTIRIWDPVNTSEAVHVLEGHLDEINGMTAFVDAQGHTKVASCSRDKTARVWDPIKGGGAIHVLEGHSDDVTGVTAFVDSTDHTRVASCSVDTTVRIWDSIKGGEAVHVLERHSHSVRGLAAFVDAKGHPRVASCSSDKEVRILDPIKGGEAIHVLVGHSHNVNDVTAFEDSEGHTWLASCSNDMTVRIWDPIQGGDAVNVLEGHSAYVNGVTAFLDANGRAWVASCSMDSTVRIWDPTSYGQPASFVIPLESLPCTISAISADRSEGSGAEPACLIVGHGNGRISYWEHLLGGGESRTSPLRDKRPIRLP